MNEYSKDLVKAVIIAKLDMWEAKQEKVRLFFEDNKAEIERIKSLGKPNLEQLYLKYNEDHNPNFKNLYGLGQGIAVDYVLYRTINGYQEHVNLRDSLEYCANSVAILKQALKKIECVVYRGIAFNEREEAAIFGDETIN